MGDGVGLEQAGVRFVPLVGFDGDMFFDQSSRFGGCSASFFIFYSSRKKEAVDGGGRDFQEGPRGL